MEENCLSALPLLQERLRSILPPNWHDSQRKHSSQCTFDPQTTDLLFGFDDPNQNHEKPSFAFTLSHEDFSLQTESPKLNPKPALGCPGNPIGEKSSGIWLVVSNWIEFSEMMRLPL